MNHCWISLDFGSSKVAIASSNDGVPSSLQLDGYDYIRSAVFYGEKIYYGEAATENGKENVNNLITNFKRLLGMQRNDPAIDEYAKHSTYEIASDNFGQCAIIIKKDSEKLLLSPTDIASKLMKEAITKASNSLGKNIIGIVLTFPPSFGERQKEELKNAAYNAGVHHIVLLSEAEAASLYSGICPNKEEIVVAVVDCGGGTFDVTTLRLGGENDFEVICTDGLRDLGGMNFTDVMEDLIFEKLKVIGINVNRKERRWVNLAEKSEEYKIEFLSKSEIDVSDDAGKFSLRITKSEYDNKCANLLLRCKNLLTRVLDETKKHYSVSKLVLSGGGMLLKSLQSMVMKTVNLEAVTRNVRNSVALGGCIYISKFVDTDLHYDGDGCDREWNNGNRNIHVNEMAQDETLPIIPPFPDFDIPPPFDFDIPPPFDFDIPPPFDFGIPPPPDMNSNRFITSNQVKDPLFNQDKINRFKNGDIEEKEPTTEYIKSLHFSMISKRAFIIGIKVAKNKVSGRDIAVLMNKDAVLPFTSKPYKLTVKKGKPFFCSLWEGREFFSDKCEPIYAYILNRDARHNANEDRGFNVVITCDKNSTYQVHFTWDDTNMPITVKEKYPLTLDEYSVFTAKIHSEYEMLKNASPKKPITDRNTTKKRREPLFGNSSGVNDTSTEISHEDGVEPTSEEYDQKIQELINEICFQIKTLSLSKKAVMKAKVNYLINWKNSLNKRLDEYSIKYEEAMNLLKEIMKNK